MKKLFLGIAIAASSLTFAQQFGAKAGLNVSNVSNSELNSKAGFYAGVFMNAPLSSQFNIQPELLYNGLGAKESGYKLNLGYISVPVMFQYKATPEFFLEAGPQFGFLVSGKAKEGSNSRDIKDEVKGFDFGLGLGAGYWFTDKIGANARYVAGLTDIAKDNGGSAVKNNGFQVGLNYKF